MTGPVLACRECTQPIGTPHRPWCGYRPYAERRAEVIEAVEEAAWRRVWNGWQAWNGSSLQLPASVRVTLNHRRDGKIIPGWRRWLRHWPDATVQPWECREWAAAIPHEVTVHRDDQPPVVVTGQSRTDVMRKVREVTR